MSGHGELSSFSIQIQICEGVFFNFVIDYREELVDASNDWRVCANGSIITGAVKRAVDEFVLSHKIENFDHTLEKWGSWYFQKP